MSGPYCEQHARAHEHGRCDMCQLEAQCAAMNEALRAGVMGYDADLRASRGHGLPVALWDWVQRALAPDAGKALLERLEHHRKTATEYLTALEEFKERLEKAEKEVLDTTWQDHADSWQKRALDAEAAMRRGNNHFAAEEAEIRYTVRAQAFEECAKVVEALFKCGLHDLATCPSSCADYVRRHAAAIRAKAKEGM